MDGLGREAPISLRLKAAVRVLFAVRRTRDFNQTIGEQAQPLSKALESAGVRRRAVRAWNARESVAAEYGMSP